jgi:hypothetical protein
MRLLNLDDKEDSKLSIRDNCFLVKSTFVEQEDIIIENGKDYYLKQYPEGRGRLPECTIEDYCWIDDTVYLFDSTEELNKFMLVKKLMQ